MADKRQVEILIIGSGEAGKYPAAPGIDLTSVPIP
jgi:hypothetical protein